MTTERLYHSIRLLAIRNPAMRAEYLKRNHILAGIGKDCHWGPWFLPLYPKLIKLHDNVVVHKKAKFVPHDMVNGLLRRSAPGVDLGPTETIGCIEVMDNVYIAMNVTVMPNVRIGKNCIISAGSTVASDIPDNSIAAGIPAKVVGRYDMFLAMRKMSAKQNKPFRNQYLPDALAEEAWQKFYQKRDR